MTGIIVVGTVLFYSVIKTDVINETIHYATGLADTIVKSTRYAMLTSDRITLGKMIDNIGEQEGVEHIQIFNKKGLIAFSSRHGEISRFADKKAAGCIGCHAGPVAATMMGRMEQARRYVDAQGNSVLAITAPIYNESDCSGAPCHVHPAGQKVLGTLDIGLFEEPLQKNLIAIRRRLIAFGAILILVVSGAIVLLLRPLLSDQVKDSRPL